MIKLKVILVNTWNPVKTESCTEGAFEQATSNWVSMSEWASACKYMSNLVHESEQVNEQFNKQKTEWAHK